MYSGDGVAFRDEEGYQQFLRDYEATLFPGHWESQLIIWCFRREYIFLSSEEWEKIEAPIVERRLNFYPEKIKFVKDMNKHISY